jgi:S1-C subfamily serine protease
MEVAGARVAQVTPGQPADLAGILADDIIVAVGDRSIQRASDLITAISLNHAGDEVTVKVRRKGQDLSVRLILSR